MAFPQVFLLLALLLALLLPLAASHEATTSGHAQQPNTTAVYALLERLYPNQSPHFTFSLLPPGALCGSLSPPCFTLSDGTSPGQIVISATGVSELTGGLGYYLREYANQTLGWPFGGSIFSFVPSPWPSVGPQPYSARRIVPWTWFQNVCTHSYTLGFYSFEEWSYYLDWQALSGINIFYGYTGQEEVQYKVFNQLGVNDTAIRSWFNGPSFLTWSRGQNSHGGAIAGPLPRSWMKAQWDLQQQILTRARSLGQVAALPGFQGNVPWPLAAALGDKSITFMNSTVPGSTATGWMNATDPFFAKVGDLWMATLIKDFGTDHVYAMDGFFHDGTGWGEQGGGGEGSGSLSSSPFSSSSSSSISSSSPPLSTCEFGPPLLDTYLDGCASEAPPCPTFPSLSAAQTACAASALCTGGVTQEGGSYQLRSGRKPLASPKHETSWLLLDTTYPPCHGPDPEWLARGRAAYGVLSRADPQAVWLWQGWALGVGHMTLSQLQGFSLAPPDPEHQFLMLDMSENGVGQWQGYGGGVTPFVQTSLHTFGGNDALKGNISRVATMLDAALTPTNPTPNVRGVGATPEGFDQNPVYYEAIFQSAWRSNHTPSSDLGEWLRARAHRRYGTFQGSRDPQCMAATDAAWDKLGAGIYAFDQGVQDSTGVALTEAQPSPLFWGSGSGDGDGRKSGGVPTPLLCSIWQAWGDLVDAAPCVSTLQSRSSPPTSPYVYDLVNTGREVLAQLASLYSGSFVAARSEVPLNASALNSTGGAYTGLLLDLDALLGTSKDFLLGPRLEQARGWGGGGGVEDCGNSVIHPGTSCADFYEWNLRVQLTTWYPTASPNASSVPLRDGDYARKHWSGLVKDYYAVRVREYTQQALEDAGRGVPYNTTAAQRREAVLAWQWTTGVNPYPTDPVGDAVVLSTTLRQKYTGVFQGC